MLISYSQQFVHGVRLKLSHVDLGKDVERAQLHKIKMICPPPPPPPPPPLICSTKQINFYYISSVQGSLLISQQVGDHVICIPNLVGNKVTVHLSCEITTAFNVKSASLSRCLLTPSISVICFDVTNKYAKKPHKNINIQATYLVTSD